MAADKAVKLEASFSGQCTQALKDLRCDLRRLGLMRSESTVLGQPFWRHVPVSEGGERLEEQQQKQ